jgi:hypothetical protein
MSLGPGDRVRLPADESNPEEVGTIISEEQTNGTVIVQLDEMFYYGSFLDDGLREVSVDLLVGIP